MWASQEQAPVPLQAVEARSQLARAQAPKPMGPVSTELPMQVWVRAALSNLRLANCWPQSMALAAYNTKRPPHPSKERPPLRRDREGCGCALRGPAEMLTAQRHAQTDAAAGP